MKRTCKHDWKLHTNSEGDFKCRTCGAMGREYRRWNKSKGDYEYRIIANRSK